MKSFNTIFRIIISMLVLATTSIAYAEEQKPIWDPNTVMLETHKLADNVYAFYQKDAEELTKKGIPLATSGGFIVGDKGVMMIETMMTERLYNQVIDMIKAVTDKPIIYAVNTSYHGDHSYGNYLLPKDTQIIQHENTKNYVDKNFKQDVEFMLKNFHEGRGIENVVAHTGNILIPVGGEKVIDLGNVKVMIKDFGFAQTGGDLFVWLSKEKIMWTGNPIISSAPSLPWLLDGHLDATLHTMKALYKFLPKDAKIIPGHGATTDVSAIKWNIDYLQAIRSGVAKGIAKGKTLEEIKKELTMDAYKGYQIFDWVHFGLNIPAAYNDLIKQSNDKK
jgi:glyoxylase-like metal-dependent hydrolase (beta-lactamase superfamily II)